MKTHFFPVIGLALAVSASALEVNTASTVTTNQPAAAPAKAATSDAKSWTVITSGARELVKMQEAGLDPSVIKAYVQSMRMPFKATSEDILYLHEHKVADEIICDWIKKGSQLTVLAAQQPARSPDLVANSNPPPITQPLVNSQPAPTVIYQAPTEAASPTVIYQTPSYGYWDNYGYTSPLYVGFSWGWPYYGYGYGRPYYGWGGSRAWGGYYRGPIHTGFGGHYGGYGGHYPGHFTGGVHYGGGYGGGHYGGGHFGGGFAGRGGGFSGGGHFGGGGGHRGR